MRTLDLREYQLTPGVRLTGPEIKVLRVLVPTVEISPSLEGAARFDVRPGPEVGSISAPGLTVRIAPKVPIDRILFLIAYSSEPKLWRQQLAVFGEHDDLVEAVAASFVHLVRRTFRHGILQGYRQREESLSGIRGRIRFEDQLRSRFGRFPPAEVRYDDFTADIDENRLIRTAVRRLLRLRLRSSRTRRALRAIDEALAEVGILRGSPRRLPSILYTRLNRRYEPAIELGRRIIASTSFDLAGPEVRASGFLIDMNQLFEDFVIVALREALGLTDRSFPQGARGYFLALDEAGKVRLRPDISWWESRSCVMVGDVKYKRNESGLGRHADLYQLLSYSTAANLPGGLLIYALGEEEPAIHLVRHSGRELHVAALNLLGSPEAILQQVDHLASTIRGLRSKVARVA